MGLGRGWRRRPRKGRCIGWQRRLAGRRRKLCSLAALDVVALVVDLLSLVVVPALAHSTTGTAACALPRPASAKSREVARFELRCSRRVRPHMRWNELQVPHSRPNQQLCECQSPFAAAMHIDRRGSARAVPEAHQRAQFASGRPLAGCLCATLHAVRHWQPSTSSEL